MLPRPPALKRIAIRNDFVRVMTQFSQIDRVEISRAEALIHQGAPLLSIRVVLEFGMLRITGA